MILASVLTLAPVMGGCSGESEQEGPALGEITGSSVDSPQNIQIGMRAPDFQFQDPDGQATSLNALRGKPVLINFWQTRCPPCVAEMPTTLLINKSGIIEGVKIGAFQSKEEIEAGIIRFIP